jgi:transposase-like protein
VAPQKRGLLSDADRARIVAALDAREAADAELRDAVRAAAKNGASVRMMAESLEVSTNTISRWKRPRA